jgi:hypothetical protein
MHGVEVRNILDLCHPPRELMLETHTSLPEREQLRCCLPRGPIVGEAQLSRGKLGSMLSPTQQLTQLHKCWRHSNALSATKVSTNEGNITNQGRNKKRLEWTTSLIRVL